MLDIKFVRDNLETVKNMLKNRNNPLNLDGFTDLEKKRREILSEVEQLKTQRNTVSKKIGAMKKAGEDTSAISAEMREVGNKISELDGNLRDIETELRDISCIFQIYRRTMYLLAKMTAKILRLDVGVNHENLTLSLRHIGI